MGKGIIDIIMNINSNVLLEATMTKEDAKFFNELISTLSDTNKIKLENVKKGIIHAEFKVDHDTVNTTIDKIGMNIILDDKGHMKYNIYAKKLSLLGRIELFIKHVLYSVARAYIKEHETEIIQQRGIHFYSTLKNLFKDITNLGTVFRYILKLRSDLSATLKTKGFLAMLKSLVSDEELYYFIMILIALLLLCFSIYGVYTLFMKIKKGEIGKGSNIENHPEPSIEVLNDDKQSIPIENNDENNQETQEGTISIFKDSEKEDSFLFHIKRSIVKTKQTFFNLKLDGIANVISTVYNKIKEWYSIIVAFFKSLNVTLFEFASVGYLLSVIYVTLCVAKEIIFS